MYRPVLRVDELRQLESAVPKHEKLIYQNKKESENAVLASYVLGEMIAKSSRLFTERVFIKNCMLRATYILCSEKKLFEGVSLAQNTVASRVDELAANIYKHLTTAAKEFHSYCSR